MVNLNDLPGGDYDASQNSDGSWNIGLKKDIPIMSVVPKGARDNSKTVDGEWMIDTVRKHKLMEKSQNYLAPIHIQHHGDGADTKQAGFLKLTRIGKLWQEGKLRDAVFASFIGVPDEIYQDIRKNKYAYRSVEIASWDKSEIASLALLSDEAPFFKLPLLNVGKETPNPSAGNLLTSGGPAVAMQEAGEGGRILFNFRGATQMADKRRFEDEEEEEVKIEDVEEVDLDDDDDDDDEFKEFMSLLKQLRAMRGSKRFEEDDDEKDLDDDEFDNGLDIEEEKELAPVMRDSRIMTLLSDLNGRLSGLEHNTRRQGVKRRIRKAVKFCLGRLEGYNVPNDIEETLISMAQSAGKNYKKVLKHFTDTFVNTAVRDDEFETLDDFENSMTINAGEEALAQFAQRGPDALAEARTALRAKQLCEKSGMKFMDGVDDPKAFVEALEHHKQVERDINRERLNGNREA